MKVFELMAELAKYPAGTEVKIARNGEDDMVTTDEVVGDGCCVIVGNHEPPKDEAAKSK